MFSLCIFAVALVCLPIKRVQGWRSKLGYVGNVSCEENFQCDDGSCVPTEWMCDDFGDCPQGEEEIGCPPCSGSRFRCDGGPAKLCLPSSWQCDGTEQCADGSDEAYCQVTVTPGPPEDTCDGFECVINGFCVPESWQCDLEVDCVDGSDEAYCFYPATVDPLTSCFEQHLDMALYGFNDLIMQRAGLQECLEYCFANDTCNSMDFVSTSSTCYISSETHLTQPGFYGPYAGSKYYYKRC